MRLRVTHRRGAYEGRTDLFDQDRVLLGRRPDCDVTFDPLKDRSASLLHCEIFRDADALHVRDLGSKNGTYLNGERVSGPVPLRTGDELRLGKDGPALVVEVGANLGGTQKVRVSSAPPSAGASGGAERSAAAPPSAGEPAASGEGRSSRYLAAWVLVALAAGLLAVALILRYR